MMWPMVWVMTVPNLAYVWAAWTQPRIAWVYLITALEQFGYGFGLASYLVFLMQICQRSRYQTAHYAICSAFMALGAMAAGIASGFVQRAFGYPAFFAICCVATIPGIVLLALVAADDGAPAAQPVPA
jgi:PAT family beta-lactamase induction signal transducer AmpG